MGVKKQESAIINSIIAAACIVTSTIILLFASTSITTPTTVTAQTQNSSTSQQQQQPQQQSTEFRVQNTSMSIPAPNANCAKFNSTSCQLIPHQIVIALPLRQDGKIWTGTVTFTASKPIETEVFHIYKSSVRPDTVRYTI
jgi:hypothetical protein